MSFKGFGPKDVVVVRKATKKAHAGCIGYIIGEHKSGWYALKITHCHCDEKSDEGKIYGFYFPEDLELFVDSV